MTRAAAELHLTHGAISRHIATLEADLGKLLFLRLTRRIVLTEVGAEFHAAVARLLGELAGEAQRLRGDDRASRLTVSTSVSLASRWLAPRLPGLRASCPPFDVQMDVTDVNVDLRAGHVDAAIRYGFGRDPNVMSARVLEESVTPVCSPAHLSEAGGLDSAADVLRCTLLHEAGMLADWTQWFALARSTLVADDIVAGWLVAPFPDLRLKAERGYDLVYRVGEREHPKIQALRSWLLKEIRAFKKTLG